ncbi:hypothetical protein HG531_011469 [Fusarium graminearum]|nr:hypothetical protein HG531_011469 [Fusarium graminearum]
MAAAISTIETRSRGSIARSAVSAAVTTATEIATTASETSPAAAKPSSVATTTASAIETSGSTAITAASRAAKAAGAHGTRGHNASVASAAETTTQASWSPTLDGSASFNVYLDTSVLDAHAITRIQSSCSWLRRMAQVSVNLTLNSTSCAE